MNGISTIPCVRQYPLHDIHIKILVYKIALTTKVITTSQNYSLEYLLVKLKYKPLTAFFLVYILKKTCDYK